MCYKEATMIVVRDVYQVKFGKIDQLLDLFDDAQHSWAQKYNYRVLTDASGPFYTAVAEVQVTNLGEWEKLLAETYSNPDFVQWFSLMEPLIESGRREFYNLVEL
jgi:hypothetical protein